MEPSGIRIITYPKKDQVFKIYDMADIHWLNKGCSKEHFRDDVAEITSDPAALVAVVGDYADWVRPGDPRFDPDAIDEAVKVSDLSRLTAKLSGLLIEELRPLSAQCLGLGMGNHEWEYMNRRSEMQVHEVICYELGVPNIGYSGWMNLIFVHNPKAKQITMTKAQYVPMRYERNLKIMTHHGKGAAGTVGGKINSLRDIVELCYDADIVMTGHLHEATVKPFVRLTCDFRATEFKNKICFGMATGSYLRNYVPGVISYGEPKGFRLTTLGCVYVTYSPSKHAINDVRL
jgi:hypothetical protein